MQSQSLLNKLKEKMKKGTGLIKPIIQIPVIRFSCPNHGKEKMFHSFELGMDGKIMEIDCECGTIYKKV